LLLTKRVESHCDGFKVDIALIALRLQTAVAESAQRNGRQDTDNSDYRQKLQQCKAASHTGSTPDASRAARVFLHVAPKFFHVVSLKIRCDL
jgi:hypothetical protein